jgi:hypothetical protein
MAEPFRGLRPLPEPVECLSVKDFVYAMTSLLCVLMFILFVVYEVRSGLKETEAKNDKVRSIPTSVEVSGGLIKIRNFAQEYELGTYDYTTIDNEITINPTGIVSFSDWSTKFFPQSCIIKLSSNHTRGKFGSAPDEVKLKGISKTEMQEKFDEARHQQLTPQEK